MRTSRVLALVAALVASLFIVAPAQAAAPASAGRFIVTLQDSADPRATAAEYHRRDGAAVEHVYDQVLNGFAGTFDEAALGRLRADGRVVRIDRDGIATTQEVTDAWGLDRVDQRYLALDDDYDAPNTGGAAHVFVIDTGIRSTHSEFVGRLGTGVDYVDGGAPEDCDGHGTHVAGTIGGATYGVAAGVTVHAVRVLDCSGSGSWSDVIAGLNWVGSFATSAPKIANLSLGGGAYSPVDTAATDLTSKATVVVAAGNSNRDACTQSPARAAGVLTVGATGATDARASYSNYGSCVELYAPGSSIVSAGIVDDADTDTLSGTSMAAPHVAGVAALKATSLSSATPANVTSAVVAGATPNVVGGVTGSQNKLLFNGSSQDHAPTVTLTASCSSSACSYSAIARDPDGQPASFAWGDSVTPDAIKPGATSAVSLGKTTGAATSKPINGLVVTVTATNSGGADSAAVRVACSTKGRKTSCSVSQVTA